MSGQPEQLPVQYLPIAESQTPFADLRQRGMELAAPPRMRPVPMITQEDMQLAYYSLTNEVQVPNSAADRREPHRSPAAFLKEHPIVRRSLIPVFAASLVLGSMTYLNKHANPNPLTLPNVTMTGPEAAGAVPAIIKTPARAAILPANHAPTGNTQENPVKKIGVSYVHRVFTDTARNRVLPVDLYFDSTPGPKPMVIFEPGRGRSTEPDPATIDNYRRLLQTIASEGYFAMAVQSPDYKQGLSDGKAKAQALDLAAAIKQVGQDPVFKGKVDVSKIALIGNSDGGPTVISAGFDPSVKIPAKLIVCLSGAVMPGAVGGSGPNLVNIDGTDDRFNPGGAENSLSSLHPQSLNKIKVKGMGHYWQLMNKPFISPIDGYNYTKTEDTLLRAALDQYLKNKSKAIMLAVGLLGNRIEAELG